MIEARDIHVTGIVQGVGFRPFVYRLARRYLVNGWVLNAADGVYIHAEGDEKLLDEFILEISQNSPAAARVDHVQIDYVPLQDFDTFDIRFSDEALVEKTTLVSPDLATCDDCLAELFDPHNRRYHYPFINCTNCGPRFTIIDSLPYDRPATSMADFPMCETCAREYGDPGDRRFHAQPNACFSCGPKISFVSLVGESTEPQVVWGNTQEESDDIIDATVELLRTGCIVAVKGLGGFHLVCDASNANTLAELRRRKKREGKAFAVMMRDIEMAHRYCIVSEEEEALLVSAARPIVLLRKRPNVALAEGLADKLPELGVMLPATPVQHLLMRAFDGMLVMTSGNVHDEPIQIDDHQAYEALAGIADAFVGNDRPIRARYDDSVVRVLDVGAGETMVQVIRRARGYAPLPLAFPKTGDGAQRGEGPSVPTPYTLLATGPEQKCTFCLTRPGEAFVSQHIGDMENVQTNDAWMQAKETYGHLLQIQPSLVACDMHPEYLTSKWAATQDLPVVAVQHHHAHIVSAMAENNLEGPVCGFAFDGTGYGVDGAIWGGEVLLANTQAFERFANFAYIPLPGGAAAIKHPLRCAYGALWAFDLLNHPAAASLLDALGDQAAVCQHMIDNDVNTPYTSSVGRLFDAASALLGLCTEPSYEGEGAVLLESVLTNGFEAAAAACASTQSASAPFSLRTEVRGAEASETILGTSETLADPFETYDTLNGFEAAAAACASTQSAALDSGAETLSATPRSAAQDFANSSCAPLLHASTRNASRSENKDGVQRVAESASTPESSPKAAYTIELVKNVASKESTAQDTSVVLLDAAAVFRGLLDDIHTQVPAAEIARRFHDAFVQAIVQTAQLVEAAYDIRTVVLSGGVFMNRYLMEHVIPALIDAGFTVAVNKDLPPNDGCISYGQAVVAAAQQASGNA